MKRSGSGGVRVWWIIAFSNLQSDSSSLKRVVYLIILDLNHTVAPTRGHWDRYIDLDEGKVQIRVEEDDLFAEVLEAFTILGPQ